MELKSARQYFQIFRGAPFNDLLDDLIEIVLETIVVRIGKGRDCTARFHLGERGNKMRSIRVAVLFVVRVGSDTICVRENEDRADKRLQ